MFSSTGIAPLAIVGQTTIKMKLGKCIDAAHSESESGDVPSKAQKMIVAADSAGQPQVNYARLSRSIMKSADLFIEMVATYRKHGWELKSVLMQPETLAQLHAQETQLLNRIAVKEAPFDALWFSRPSHNNREAWEIRLLAETQYALFETFEADETEEQRDDVKREMEARLREYVGRE